MIVQTNGRRKAVTSGDFMAAAYRAWGIGRAKGLVRLAVRTPGTTANRGLTLLVLLFAFTSSCQSDIFIECAGQMRFLDQPSDVAACSGESPVVLARIRPAFAQLIQDGGTSYFVSKPHTVYWQCNGTNIPGSMYVFSPDPPEGPATVSFTLTNGTSALNGLYDVVLY
jgi:hypothetical protein